MAENTKRDQCGDLPPPKPGRTFFGTAETAKNPINQSNIAGDRNTVRDASERNDSETSRVETGNIRGMRSLKVLKERAAVYEAAPVPCKGSLGLSLRKMHAAVVNAEHITSTGE